MKQKGTLSKMMFLPGKKSVEFHPDESVLETALRHQIALYHSCGGMGSCGTCRIVVKSDLSLLAPRTDIENEIASDRQFSPEERLACQTKAIEGLIVEIPKRHLT